jgi:hypothetical protein
MSVYRMNRLFGGASERCLDVAVDDGFLGFLGEPPFPHRITDLARAVGVLCDAMIGPA